MKWFVYIHTFISLPSYTVGVLNRELGLFTFISLCPTPYGGWPVLGFHAVLLMVEEEGKQLMIIVNILILTECLLCARRWVKHFIYLI